MNIRMYPFVKTLVVVAALALIPTLSRAAFAIPSSPAAVVSSIHTDEESSQPAKTGGVRAVRLSSVEGQVQIVQDSQVIADPATANLPLFEGTQVITGNDGRAEVELEDGNLARLSPNSTLTLTVLQHEGAGAKTEIVLNSGLAYFEMQPSNSEHTLRISYGAGSMVASSFTIVRITLDDPPGELAVFSGNVHLESGDAVQVDVHGGESVSLNANDRSGYNLAETVEPNSWDSWNADRDQLLNAQSAGKTSATADLSMNQTPGMSELDANGNWYNVPGQGYVWSPYEAESAGASWDPYGYGSWVSYPGYGYVFTSGYGWGYAPYQCGMWNFYDNFGWGWAPGQGCNTWYSGDAGYGGWGYNLGNSPHGYKPPRRPGGPHPIHPRPVGGAGSRLRVASAPVIPVDRRQPGSTSLAANSHPGQPVTIAGHVVIPLAPLAPRQSYSQSASSFVNGTSRPGMVYYPNGTHSGYYPATTGRPGSAIQPAYRPSGGGANGANHPSQSQSSRSASSGNSGGSHVSSAPSGGGGGGGHASGGGGSSGGGGGTHK